MGARKVTDKTACFGCGRVLDVREPGVYAHVRRSGDASGDGGAIVLNDCVLCERCFDELDATVVRWDLDASDPYDGECEHAGRRETRRVAVTPTYVEDGRVSGSTHLFRLCGPCYRAFLRPGLDE